MDFLEASFQQQTSCGGQKTVDEINEIFRECGIGYHLTPLVEHHVEKEFWIVPGRKQKGIVTEYNYPKAIRTDNQLLHQSVIEPTLHFLSDSYTAIRARRTHGEFDLG